MKKLRKMAFPRQPIHNVLFAGFGGLVVLAVVAVLYIGLNYTTQLTKDYHQVLIQSVLEKMTDEVEDLMVPVENQALWFSDQVKNGNLDLDDHNQVETFMRGVLGATPNVTGMGILYPDGVSRFILRSENRWREEVQTEPEENDHFFKLIQESGTIQWSPLFWYEDLQQTIIDIRAPLYQNGEFHGVLFIGVTVADLSKTIATISTDLFLTPFILYGEDHIIAHPLLSNGGTISDEQGSKADWVEGKGEIPLPRVTEFQDLKLARLISGETNPVRLITPIPDVQMRSARINEDIHILAIKDLLRFGEHKWRTGMYINVAKSDNSAGRRLFEMAAVGFLILVISVALSFGVGRKIARPIVRLAETARAIRRGALEDLPTLPRSRLRELDQAALAVNDMVEGLHERNVIREVFGRYVPESVATSLMQENGELRPISTQATILFSDLEGFTKLTEEVGPEAIVEILNSYFSAVVEVLEHHGGVVTQFQGDAVLATFNVPIEQKDHARSAICAAIEIQKMLKSRKFGGITLRSRIGINSGQVVAGAVGAEGRLNYTVHGDAVNLAARIEGLNKNYHTDLLISENTAKLVPDIPLESVGETNVRGRQDGVGLFIVKL